jgi:hypothetical protein
VIEVIVGLLCVAHAITWLRLRRAERATVLVLNTLQGVIDVIELQQKLRLLDKLGQNVDDVEAEFQRIIKDFKA